MKNIDDLEPILKDLYLISGLNMSIFDTDYTLIASYPHCKSPFCALIDKDPQALQHCIKYDRDAFEHVKKSGKLYIYQCYYHLYEAVVPLYDFDILSGYLMMGQTLTNSQFDKELIKKEASTYIDDQDELIKAIHNISIHSKEQIIAFASIVDICAKYITLTHRMKNNKKDLPQQIKKYLQQNYQTNVNIENLCNYFYCSKTTLMNSFQKKYQISIHQYLMKIRMEHAVELLLHSQLSIQDIALKCGYKDANYFTKAFHKQYDMSPSQYRHK